MLKFSMSGVDCKCADNAGALSGPSRKYITESFTGKHRQCGGVGLS